eukprot:COSAG02_NODE_972_length_15544_cov_3.570735_16_plen_183_part_00
MGVLTSFTDAKSSAGLFFLQMFCAVNMKTLPFCSSKSTVSYSLRSTSTSRNFLVIYWFLCKPAVSRVRGPACRIGVPHSDHPPSSSAVRRVRLPQVPGQPTQNPPRIDRNPGRAIAPELPCRHAGQHESVSSALGRIFVQEPWGWSARWMAHAGVRALVAGSAQQQGGAVSSLVRHARHVIG